MASRRLVPILLVMALCTGGLNATQNTKKDKPVKVYILSGQSNMVGIGQISGRSTRWGNEILDPVVSVYKGAYSPTADYDRLTPIATKTLPVYGGTKPTPFPGGGTHVVRGAMRMKTSGVYEFNPGYANSSHNIMEVDGREVYRKEVGKDAVRVGFKFIEGQTYPFKITFVTDAATGLGWSWRTDIPGTLDTVVKVDKKFPHLIDGQGNWTVRDDVWYRGVVTATANKWLTVGCGANAGSIGPELQFGHIMGDFHDEPVILIKASQGNRSLAWDILPPGSERYTFAGRTYAGYQDTPSSWIEGEEKKPVNWYAGKQYDDFVNRIHDVLDNFATNFPQYQDRGYEIAGFVWWQGHKDGNAAHASRYEFNLVNLIKSFRKEFNAPKAPFVIGTIGFKGWDMAGPHLTVAKAQLAVSGETGRYPEFTGNVLTAETRDFWIDHPLSPRNQDFHYNGNAETYLKVGDVLGRAMVKLVSAQDTQTGHKTRAQLQEDFLKLKFGMFLHYNMATYQGVQWVEGYPSPAEFNPGGPVDTDAWADAAVSAGMTYGVLTVKHVGGFCLWDSKHTTYDIMHPDCPYQQDLVAQFIKSFKSRGMKVGLYYCWRNPGFGDKFKVLPPECDPATHTLQDQNEFQKAQVKELLIEYPDVFYIWNDALDDRVMPAEEILTLIRSVRPDVLASANWWSWAKKGTPYLDIAVKETRHFPDTNTAQGETCWKLEQGWFWNKGYRAASTANIMDHMAKAHARHSNFLLNVAPNRQGRFEGTSLATLTQIGRLWRDQATNDLPK